MGLFAGDRVFRGHLHFGFHGSAPGVGHLGVQDDQVADPDGLPEDHLVNGNGHHPALGVTHAG